MIFVAIARPLHAPAPNRESRARHASAVSRSSGTVTFPVWTAWNAAPQRNAAP